MMEPLETEPFPVDDGYSEQEFYTRPSYVPIFPYHRAVRVFPELHGEAIPLNAFSSQDALIVTPTRPITRERDAGVVSRKPKSVFNHVTSSFGDQPIIFSLVGTICVLLVAFFALLLIRTRTTSENMMRWLDYAILGTYCFAALSALVLMLGGLLWTEILEYKEYGAAERQRQRLQDKQNAALLLTTRRKYEEFMEGDYDVGVDAELPGVPVWKKDELDMTKYRSKISSSAVRYFTDIRNFDAGRSNWSTRYYGPKPKILTTIPEHNQHSGAASKGAPGNPRNSPAGSRHDAPNSELLYPPAPDFRARPLTYPSSLGSGSFSSSARPQLGAGTEIGAGLFDQPRLEVNAESGNEKNGAKVVGKFAEGPDVPMAEDSTVKFVKQEVGSELRPTTPGLAV